MNSAEIANVENKKERTEKEREHHRLYQMKYYHAKSQLKVVCKLCGSKVTAKSLVKHMRTPKCKKKLAGGQEAFKDRVEKLERVFGELTLQKADELVCFLCETSSPQGLHFEQMSTFGPNVSKSVE